MIPAWQTKHGIHGNCEAAAVASILECPLVAVPQIESAEDYPTRYFRRLSLWLRRNYGVYYVHCTTGWEALGKIVWKPQGWSVGTVRSDLGEDYTHAVVCFDGKIVHDPFILPGLEPKADNRPLLGHSIFAVYDLEILREARR